MTLIANLTAFARPGKKTCEGMLAHAERVLDWHRLQDMSRLVVGKKNELKFLNARNWLEKSWGSATMLDLIDRKPLHILDIGTGGAHFPFVCRYLGHEVVALDRPGNGVYEPLSRWIGEQVVPHEVAPFRPLPSFGRKFDLITAFRVEFNYRTDGTLYDLPEWEFFLNHVRDDLLAEGGRLCLKLNKKQKRSGPRPDDPRLQSFFAGRGAKLQIGCLVFDPLR